MLGIVEPCFCLCYGSCPSLLRQRRSAMRPVSVGILSIGDMGLGIAKLLQAHGYRVLTVGLGRRYGCVVQMLVTSNYSVLRI